MRGLTIAMALGALAGTAGAEPDWAFVAGTSHGLDSGQMVPAAAAGQGCGQCQVAGGGALEPTSPAEPRFGMVGVALVGSEGRLRGGGELFSLIGSGDGGTGGYASAVTYAGTDSGRLFAHAGLGVGRYWGGPLGGLAAFAGNVRTELGARVTHQWIVVIRGDLVVNNAAASPFATLGLQFVPGAR